MNLELKSVWERERKSKCVVGRQSDRMQLLVNYPPSPSGALLPARDAYSLNTAGELDR